MVRDRSSSQTNEPQLTSFPFFDRITSLEDKFFPARIFLCCQPPQQLAKPHPSSLLTSKLLEAEVGSGHPPRVLDSVPQAFFPVGWCRHSLSSHCILWRCLRCIRMPLLAGQHPTGLPHCASGSVVPVAELAGWSPFLGSVCFEGLPNSQSCLGRLKAKRSGEN